MDTYKTLAHVDVRIGKDRGAIGAAAARDLVALANKAIRRTGSFNLCLSGGETPKSLFDALASHHQETMDWSRVFVYWGDERCVGPDDPASNYGMARAHLLTKLPIPTFNVLRIKAELPATDAAELYRQDLRKLAERLGTSWPRFDLVLLGIGDDGHTASLFPGTAALHETIHAVVANPVPQLQTIRITVTYPVLNQARSIMMLASGDKKAGVLRRVLDTPPDPEALPMQGVRPSDGTLTWYLDTEASSQLKAASPGSST